MRGTCICRHGRHQRADPGSSRLPYLWWLEAFGIWRHQPARHGRREVLDEGQDSHPALAGWFGYWGKRIRHSHNGLIGSFHDQRSEEHTSELQSLMRISYAVFCLKKKNKMTRSTP